jgi:hypothetical protein
MVSGECVQRIEHEFRRFAGAASPHDILSSMSLSGRRVQVSGTVSWMDGAGIFELLIHSSAETIELGNR